jgi:hypothetical protein
MHTGVLAREAAEYFEKGRGLEIVSWWLQY